MQIIDAHMHYYDKEGFIEVAAKAGYENTAACWQRICQENNIVFSVAMGNTLDTYSPKPRNTSMSRITSRS